MTVPTVQEIKNAAAAFRQATVRWPSSGWKEAVEVQILSGVLRPTPTQWDGHEPPPGERVHIGRLFLTTGPFHKQVWVVFAGGDPEVSTASGGNDVVLQASWSRATCSEEIEKVFRS